MDAITIPESGGPEVLTWAAVPDPEPGPGELLIDVAATAVNRADLMQREGHYPPPPGASPYLGLECAGRVAALGPDVTGWAVGDPVCALLSGGGYATKVAVPAGQVLPIPAGLDAIGAAALPEVACTVWSMVGDLARLTKGDTFLVHGGSSGIGTHAIQLGVALGARVLCTAGSAAKLAACRELGADVAINYRDEDFVRRVEDEGGADVILDVVGAPYLARNIQALAPNGRLVIIGMQGGTRTELDLTTLMRRRASVIAATLRARPVAEKAAIVARVREVVWPLVDSGAIRPVIDRVIPLRDAAEAHRRVEEGSHIGKVVLAV
ncbi:MAG TPA: NAD(P)H-quinone oxidoreductase [Mycobacteriales bacterium]|nr:NAD(P)H-quinone oxidoreductase [Mycobacteriales bacterium]